MNGLQIVVGGLTITILVLVIGLAKLAHENKKSRKDQE